MKRQFVSLWEGALIVVAVVLAWILSTGKRKL